MKWLTRGSKRKLVSLPNPRPLKRVQGFFNAEDSVVFSTITGAIAMAGATNDYVLLGLTAAGGVVAAVSKWPKFTRKAALRYLSNFGGIPSPHSTENPDTVNPGPTDFEKLEPPNPEKLVVVLGGSSAKELSYLQEIQKQIQEKTGASTVAVVSEMAMAGAGASNLPLQVEQTKGYLAGKYPGKQVDACYVTPGDADITPKLGFGQDQWVGALRAFGMISAGNAPFPFGNVPIVVTTPPTPADKAASPFGARGRLDKITEEYARGWTKLVLEANRKDNGRSFADIYLINGQETLREIPREERFTTELVDAQDSVNSGENLPLFYSRFSTASAAALAEAATSRISHVFASPTRHGRRLASGPSRRLSAPIPAGATQWYALRDVLPGGAPATPVRTGQGPTNRP